MFPDPAPGFRIKIFRIEFRTVQDNVSFVTVRHKMDRAVFRIVSIQIALQLSQTRFFRLRIQDQHILIHIQFRHNFVQFHHAAVDHHQFFVRGKGFRASHQINGHGVSAAFRIFRFRQRLKFIRHGGINKIHSVFCAIAILRQFIGDLRTCHTFQFRRVGHDFRHILRRTASLCFCIRTGFCASVVFRCVLFRIFFRVPALFCLFVDLIVDCIGCFCQNGCGCRFKQNTVFQTEDLDLLFALFHGGNLSLLFIILYYSSILYYKSAEKSIVRNRNKITF